VARSFRPVAAGTRYLGALALLAVGLDHLEQLSVDHYSAIPTIGTLFALNFASAALIACCLAVPIQRLPGHAGRVAVSLLCVGGIGVAAGSLAGLVISESAGLFGFMETGYRAAIVLSIAFDAATIVLLGAHLALASSPRARGAPGAPPGADAITRNGTIELKGTDA
jgi:hypothetical protein